MYFSLQLLSMSCNFVAQLTFYILLLISLDFATVSFTSSFLNLLYESLLCLLHLFPFLSFRFLVYLPKMFLVSGVQRFEGLTASVLWDMRTVFLIRQMP